MDQMLKHDPHLTQTYAYSRWTKIPNHVFDILLSVLMHLPAELHELNR